MRLADKAILITGSTTGIGKAAAKACVAEGARVVVHGRDRATGEALAEELGAPLHLSDLADPATPDDLIAFAVERLGKLDGLINNAALVPDADIHGTDLGLWEKTMTVNLRAPFFLIKAALPHLSESRGRVLNVGSVNAYAGEETLLPYAISKGGLMTLTRNLGDTLHRTHGVVVNQINPGWTLTENETQRKRDGGLPGDWYRLLGGEFAPSGRILKAEEIAEAMVYWMSDAAGPISGCVVDLEQYPAMGRNPTKNHLLL